MYKIYDLAFGKKMIFHFHNLTMHARTRVGWIFIRVRIRIRYINTKVFQMAFNFWLCDVRDARIALLPHNKLKLTCIIGFATFLRSLLRVLLVFTYRIETTTAELEEFPKKTCTGEDGTSTTIVTKMLYFPFWLIA